MTNPTRTLPSQDAGSALPFDALVYQNLVNAVAANLMDRAPMRLINVAGTTTLTGDTEGRASGNGLTQWKTNYLFWFIAPAACAGPSSFAVDGLPAKNMRDRAASVLASGAWNAGDLVFTLYEGSYLRLVGSYDFAAALASSGMAPGFVSGFALATNATDPNNDIDVAAGFARSEDNNRDIILGSALTKRMDAVWAQGMNQGCVLQSANLAGTISVINASSNVAGTDTAFLTDFVVGDPVYTNGGNCRRITAITSNTAMTVESNWSATETGITYKRGGKARNSCIRIFAIRNDSAGTADVAVSARDVPIDMPTGWSQYARIGYVLTGAAGNNYAADQFGNLTLLHTAIMVDSRGFTTTAPPATPDVSVITVQTKFPPGVIVRARAEVTRPLNQHGNGALIVFPAAQTSPAADYYKLQIIDDGVAGDTPELTVDDGTEVPLNNTSTFKYQFTYDRGSLASCDFTVSITFYGWFDDRSASIGGVSSNSNVGAVAWPSEIAPATITADQNNYNPTGLNAATHLRVNASDQWAITGIAGGADGRMLVIFNGGTNPFRLSHNNTGSLAVNRFYNGDAHRDLVLGVGDTAFYRYNSSTALWRLISTTASRVNSIISADRPGEDLTLWTTSPETAPSARKLASALTSSSSTILGASAQLTGAGKLGPYQFKRLETGHVYAVDFEGRHAVSDGDPANNKYSIGVAYFGYSKAFISSAYIAQNVAISSGALKTTYAVPGSDSWPVGSFYATPFVEHYGTNGILFVSYLRWVDLTLLLSADAQNYPAENTYQWMLTPSASPSNSSPITSAVLGVSTLLSGAVIVLTGANELGSFRYDRVQSGRTYKLSLTARIVPGDTDSANHKYSTGFCCFDQTKTFLGYYYLDQDVETGTNFPIAPSYSDITTSQMPAGTTYVRRFFRTYGTTVVWQLGELSFEDVTSAGTQNVFQTVQTTALGNPAAPINNIQDWDTASDAVANIVTSDDTGRTRKYRQLKTGTGAMLEQLWASNGVLRAAEYLTVTGQSLAGGGDAGTPLITTAPYPYHVVMYSAGDIVGAYTIQPTTEPPVTALATGLHHLIENDSSPRRIWVARTAAAGGTSLKDRSTGTVTYTAQMNGLSNTVPVITTNYGLPALKARYVAEKGGENERADILNAVVGAPSPAQYAFGPTGLVQFRIDIDTDYKVITGQTEDVSLIVIQLDAKPSPTGVLVEAGPIAHVQREVCNDDPTKMIFGGPTYQFGHCTLASGGNILHMPASAYDDMGEMIAKVIHYMQNLGGWTPFDVIEAEVAIASNIVTLPLTRDGVEVNVTDLPLRNFYGAEYRELAGASGIIITDIALQQGTGRTEIKITLSGTPNPLDMPFIHFADAAVTAVDGRSAGWSNIFYRDSYPSRMRAGKTLNDWLPVLRTFLGDKTIETETQAIINQMACKPDYVQKWIVNNFVKAMKAAGIWTKHDYILSQAMHDNQAALLNLIAPAGTAGLAVGSPNFLPGIGYDLDGATQYVNAQLALTALTHFTLSDANLAVYCLTDVSTASYAIGTSGNNNSSIAPHGTTGLFTSRANDGTNTTIAVPNGTGLFEWNRNGATYDRYKDGAVLDSAVAVPASSIATGNLYVGRSSTGYRQGKFPFAMASSHLTSTEIAARNDAVARWLKATGAIPI